MRPAARTEGPGGKPRPDTEVVFDPASYVRGVPFDALARLRHDTPVAWVAEIPVLGWPEGPGFWLVLARTSSLTYAGPPSYLRSNFQRGVKRLPVAWTA